VDLPEELHGTLRRALDSAGIRQLYTHQDEAYRTVRDGRSTAIVTPTASGKTLCYNLPVLQRMLEEPETRALYLFPTKALSQDQQAALGDLAGSVELPVKVATYDGDTPTSVRASARTTGQIVISNPDMLHAGILPNHPKWTTFLKNLRYVVVDEVHTYRGVFGSHLTNLFRRLRRIARFYGADPVFICCSATIGNPRELAERVVGAPMHLIDENGAPKGPRHVILYNPPLVDRAQGIRRGVVREAKHLALRFLREGIKTIVFAKSRVRTELIASYINRALQNVYTDNSRVRVEGYRGGYLPTERRDIERGLREGTVHGVVSTNALELGIDIGGLDVAIAAGIPGSVASAWQQAGRAGRTRKPSAAILVASSHPLDQYMVQHPDYFFGRPPERGYVDPENAFILTDHLKCAVFELPFSGESGAVDSVFPSESVEYLDALEETGVVRFTRGRFYWSERSYPAEEISLRSATSDNVVIVDRTAGRNQVIGEMDRPSAKELVHDNAVYIHRGKQYIVAELDIENRRCYVEQSGVNYYTDALVKRDIKVLYEDRELDRTGFRMLVGDVLVRTQVAKFKKIRFDTHENVGYGEISLPEEEMHTRAACVVMTPDGKAGDVVSRQPLDLQAVVIARTGRLISRVAPLYLLCEEQDIGVAERVRDPHFQAPALYLYDAYPGGIGLAESVIERWEELVAAALELVTECPCQEGCPSCIGPRDQGSEIDRNPKLAVKEFLAQLVTERVRSE